MVRSASYARWDLFIGCFLASGVVRPTYWKALMHISLPEDCSHSASGFGRVQVRRRLCHAQNDRGCLSER
jgi:hypothetical protein